MPETTDDEKLKSCEQTDCPVRASGKCLEGLEPESCSHFYWSDGEESEGEQDKKPDQNNLIRLFPGTELHTKELGIVTYEHPTNLIIIIGESFSGKSTVLTSIFDMFQVGKFKQFYFAGSYTQYGFESRCHLSRAPSGLVEPDTAHTQSIEFNFLHIAFKDKENLSRDAHHLLLSDISGERFNMAINSATMMTEMSLMKEAEHLVYLLDGEKLADKFQRNAIVTRANQFISRAVDNGLFDTDTEITIIFTKYDLLTDIVNDGTLEKIKKSFVDRFEANLSAIKFEVIAARPKPPTADIPFGFGLEHLLSVWLNKRKLPELNVGTIPSSERYFELYSYHNG
ncbi:hypothetical protein [Mucilaginibacter sp. 44-25]|uniref:TRAFAC clade GTPase domain-containing protein n=1 Tax=Mucilaginibacter sp. 44-25 TaxID=1895794 RepID=UPI000963B96F|nr:hypothetical protein [Mucilaginibacter sp. 44-25]OJW12784.1 MAG: hypothetical protein BGO48_02565 [Mucilaginibacter sp. 44-25]